MPIASIDDYLEDKMNLNIFVLFWFDAKKKNEDLLLNFSFALQIYFLASSDQMFASHNFAN